MSVDPEFAQGYSFAIKDFVKMPPDTALEPTATASSAFAALRRDK
ncbi:MAG: hypothetical protein ABSD57_08200 [Verrucomicrobiota bacterium]